MKIVTKNHPPCAINITPTITYIGVVFSYIGSLSVDCYYLHLLMETANMAVAIKSGSTGAELDEQHYRENESKLLYQIVLITLLSNSQCYL